MTSDKDMERDYTPENLDQARRLLGAGDGPWAQQAYEVVLREADRYDDDPRLVWFVPIGNVIGIAVKRGEERPKDEDWVFIPLVALGAALSSFGFVSTPAVGIGTAAPRAAKEAKRD